MTPTVKNLTVHQGARFRYTIRVNENGSGVALAGYTVRAQIRETVTSSTVLAEWDDFITVSGSDVLIDVPDEETAAYTWESGVYDVEIESAAGAVDRIMEGWVKVSPEVTR